MAYSRARPLITGLVERGARPLGYDPLLTDLEIERTGAAPYAWGQVQPDVAVIVTQTADSLWATLDSAWFPGLRLLVDGRNSLRDLTLPDGVVHRGIGRRG